MGTLGQAGRFLILCLGDGAAGTNCSWVEKNVGGAKTEYVYGIDGNVVAEVNGSNGGWQVGYVYRGGQLLAQYSGGTTYFAHADHLGSTRVLTDINGSGYDNYDYLPFGETRSGGWGTTHKFTGDERDSETGLDHTLFRQYSSSLGRWSSPDPYPADPSNPQTWNRYAYVLNNPLRWVDPTGQDFCAWSDGSKSDDPPEDGGATYNECEEQGGSWVYEVSAGEPGGFGFGQVGAEPGQSAAYQSQQQGYSSWTNQIPLSGCTAIMICTQASGQTQVLQNSIQIQDALSPPAISALSSFSFIPGIDPKNDVKADNSVRNYVLSGTLTAKPQPALNQSSPMTDTFLCTLQMSNGSSGSYSCRDTKNGATVPIVFTAKSITVTCTGPGMAGQLPTIITGTGVGADSLKITACSN